MGSRYVIVPPRVLVLIPRLRALIQTSLWIAGYAARFTQSKGKLLCYRLCRHYTFVYNFTLCALPIRKVIGAYLKLLAVKSKQVSLYIGDLSQC